MKHIMLIFGTRPEAIKMCPIIKELKKRNNVKITVCVTGQHKEMLDQVLNNFDIIPDYNLNIMEKQQTILNITTNVIAKVNEVLTLEEPDIVLVHGDTTTTFAAALACYYRQIKVAHIEAGLRTYNIYSPYPEEFNRQAVGIIANYHFSPTEKSKQNLIKEGKDESSIYVTGNTVIDALKTTVVKDYNHPELQWCGNSRLLLLTSHRRENIGEPMREIFMAIRLILNEYKNVKVIYPIHKNPLIRDIANEIFEGVENIHIIEALDVADFHNILARSYIVLTDSGGVQEESAYLGVPTLVIRETTERLEGIETGVLRLVGTEKEKIYENCKVLLDDDKLHEQMSKSKNPYGSGNASEKIVEILVDN